MHWCVRVTLIISLHVSSCRASIRTDPTILRLEFHVFLITELPHLRIAGSLRSLSPSLPPSLPRSIPPSLSTQWVSPAHWAPHGHPMYYSTYDVLTTHNVKLRMRLFEMPQQPKHNVQDFSWYGRSR